MERWKGWIGRRNGQMEWKEGWKGWMDELKGQMDRRDGGVERQKG